MASKPVNTDLDFQKVSQLLNVLLHNSNDGAINSLATALGQVAYTTDSKRIKYWDGTIVRTVATLEDIVSIITGATIKNFTITGDGFNASFPLTHGLNSDWNIWSVKDATTGKTVYPTCDQGTTINTYTWSVIPSSGSVFKVTILGIQNGGSGSSGGGGSGSADVFTTNPTFVLSGSKSFGKYTNGQTPNWIGLTAVQAIMEAAVEYLDPSFTSFSISGQSQKIEVGLSITAGSKSFLWGTSNSANVQSNSITIRNQTSSTDLATGLVNDGSEAITISAINMTTETTQTFRISGNKTVGGAMGVADFSINSRYKVFYGPAASAPNNSATARALSSVRFRDDGNMFNLDTGSTQRIFAVIIPATMSLVSVVDLDALNAVITSEYVLSTFNVNDAAGTPVSYKAYIMTQSIPYSSNHRHQITIG